MVSHTASRSWCHPAVVNVRGGCYGRGARGVGADETRDAARHLRDVSLRVLTGASTARHAPSTHSLEGESLRAGTMCDSRGRRGAGQGDIARGSRERRSAPYLGPLCPLKKPLTRDFLVAGVGFEPTTFGL